LYEVSQAANILQSSGIKVDLKYTPVLIIWNKNRHWNRYQVYDKKSRCILIFQHVFKLEIERRSLG
jgi:hypothetical protein